MSERSDGYQCAQTIIEHNPNVSKWFVIECLKELKHDHNPCQEWIDGFMAAVRELI